MAQGKRSSGRSGSSPGCLLWLAAFVAVLLLFILNWGKIKATLERTNFNEIVRTQRGTEPGRPTVPVAPAPRVDGEPATTPAPGSSESPSTLIQPSPPPASLAPPAAPSTPSASPAPSSTSRPAAPSPGAAGPVGLTPGPGQTPQVPPTAAPRTRPTSLYFVRIDDDGVIVRQEVKRVIPASDSPLTDSVGALLKGPTEDELRRKLMSLVPQGTKLLSAQVRGSTAYLNFNEAFMYNHYGIEGYAGQLKQVVYTATSFPTVQDVQILIEGERHDYLGGEGVYIGKPLSRNSF